jgi:hypothetical protein
MLIICAFEELASGSDPASGPGDDSLDVHDRCYLSRATRQTTTLATNATTRTVKSKKEKLLDEGGPMP